VSSIVVTPGAEKNVTVSVKNTGAHAGDEVIMAYFTAGPGVIPAGEPAGQIRKQMFDFTRLHVDSGETEKVVFSVTADSVNLHTASGEVVRWPGQYTLEFTNGNWDPAGTANVVMTL
jgi:hypothetical protein